MTVSSACLEPEEVRHCMLSGMRCDILESMKYPKTMFAILLSLIQTERYGSVCHKKTTTKFSLNSSKTRVSMSYLLWQQPGQLASFPDPTQLSIASSTVSRRGPGRKHFCLQQAMIATKLSSCMVYSSKVLPILLKMIWYGAVMRVQFVFCCQLQNVNLTAYFYSIWKRIRQPKIKPFWTQDESVEILYSFSAKTKLICSFLHRMVTLITVMLKDSGCERFHLIVYKATIEATLVMAPSQMFWGLSINVLHVVVRWMGICLSGYVNYGALSTLLSWVDMSSFWIYTENSLRNLPFSK